MISKNWNSCFGGRTIFSVSLCTSIYTAFHQTQKSVYLHRSPSLFSKCARNCNSLLSTPTLTMFYTIGPSSFLLRPVSQQSQTSAARRCLQAQGTRKNSISRQLASNFVESKLSN